MTRYTEAFHQLGYEIRSPRNQVSAEKPDGIAVAIHKNEPIEHEPLSNIRVSFDTREMKGWEQNRMHLPGNKWRRKHLQKAIDEFDSRVDVILWDGKNAQACGKWKITYFDINTGHHRLEFVSEHEQ